jgi:small subunit ribosomal protein S8
MRHDLLSDALYTISNAEKIGRKTCIVPASNLVKNVLKVIQDAKFVGSFEFISDDKSGKFQIELLGRINKTRSIRPRFSVKRDGFEKWESRYLPAKGFGILIISTPKGVMNQKDAIEKGIGGRLLAYIY